MFGPKGEKGLPGFVGPRVSDLHGSLSTKYSIFDSTSITQVQAGIVYIIKCKFLLKRSHQNRGNNLDLLI